MRILLVRHGQNLANITREFSYRKVDYPLTDLGRQQAEHTARYLATQGIDTVASSPLKRAKETAQPIADARGLPLHLLEHLREVNSGEFEDKAPTDENWKLYDDVMDAWLRDERHVRFPGGEDFHELGERVLSAVRDLLALNEGATRVAVSHGGTIFALTRALCPEADVRGLWYSVGLPNCGITEIELDEPFEGQPGRLIRFGDNSHIPGAKPGWGH